MSYVDSLEVKAENGLQMDKGNFLKEKKVFFSENSNIHSSQFLVSVLREYSSYLE